MRPESEEKKRPTIKTTTPHWLYMELTKRAGKQTSMHMCVCACSRCTRARQAHLIDRSVFVTSVNMLLYFDFKLSHCPVHIVVVFLLIKKFFSFFCTYSHLFCTFALSAVPSLAASVLPSLVFYMRAAQAQMPHFFTFYDRCFLDRFGCWFIFRSLDFGMELLTFVHPSPMNSGMLPINWLVSQIVVSKQFISAIFHFYVLKMKKKKEHTKNE